MALSRVRPLLPSLLILSVLISCRRRRRRRRCFQELKYYISINEFRTIIVAESLYTKLVFIAISVSIRTFLQKRMFRRAFTFFV